MTETQNSASTHGWDWHNHSEPNGQYSHKHHDGTIWHKHAPSEGYLGYWIVRADGELHFFREDT